MKAFVDPELCIGCTQCAGLCPEVYLGAEPGTLGAADAEFRVYECFHVGTTSIQNEKKALTAVWPGGAENML